MQSPQMALLLAPTCSPMAMAMAFTVTSVSRVYHKGLILQPRSFNRVRNYTRFSAQDRCSIIIRASSGDGKDLEGNDVPEEDQEQTVSIENLPLESKLQMKLEAKLRMKLAKKLRLRRKRLVRKRHLRKKGRWPPSKMRKLKNV